MLSTIVTVMVLTGVQHHRNVGLRRRKHGPGTEHEPQHEREPAAGRLGELDRSAASAFAAGMLGNSTSAMAAPATIDSGNPIAGSRVVRDRSWRPAANGTVEASANNDSPRMISARW